jgi:hypothetical protein
LIKLKAPRGVAIFAKACFGHPSPSKQQKLRDHSMPAAPQPSCFPRFIPNKGYKTEYAMTRRDFVRLGIFTTQKALPENAQPYRFWGLLDSCLAAVVKATTPTIKLIASPPYSNRRHFNVLITAISNAVCHYYRLAYE